MDALTDLVSFGTVTLQLSPTRTRVWAILDLNRPLGDVGRLSAMKDAPDEALENLWNKLVDEVERNARTIR